MKNEEELLKLLVNLQCTIVTLLLQNTQIPDEIVKQSLETTSLVNEMLEKINANK